MNRAMSLLLFAAPCAEEPPGPMKKPRYPMEERYSVR